jgi:hypothetical protein
MKKKQFLYTAVVISGILFSCSKEKIGTPADNPSEVTPAANSEKGGGGGSTNLNKGLLGRFEFNNTLRDTTKQLADGTSTVGRVLFTTDRHDVSNRAIYFNAAYGVNIFDVPCTPGGASLSVWIRHDTLPSPGWLASVYSARGFIIQQSVNYFNASYYTGILGVPPNVNTATGIDKNWHHMAATRDNTELRFYIDGVLIGTAPTPAGAGPYPALDNYLLGSAFNNYWKGALDDLRFYNRVLTPTEVSQLATF